MHFKRINFSSLLSATPFHRLLHLIAFDMSGHKFPFIEINTKITKITSLKKYQISGTILFVNGFFHNRGKKGFECFKCPSISGYLYLDGIKAEKNDMVFFIQKKE